MEDGFRENTEALLAVGRELHRLRTAAGLSLRELGKRSGLSPGFLSLAERGATSLSLTSLFALASALGTEPARLLDPHAAGRPRHPAYALHRAGEPPAEDAWVDLGARAYAPLSTGDPDRALEPLLVRVRPEGDGAAAGHRTTHSGEEFVHLLRGALEFRLRGEEVRLGPGDGIHFSSRVPHSVRNPGPGTAEALWVTTEPMT